MDHRWQLAEMADQAGKPHSVIPHFKVLAMQAADRVAQGRPGYGTLLDGIYGQDAMFLAAQKNLWVARPVERPGSRPLEFEVGDDLGAHLVEWPVTHTVKVLCLYHPDDDDALKKLQHRELLRVNDAARTLGRELLIEVIGAKFGKTDDVTAARSLAQIYALGIKPDWWKLEPQKSRAAWQKIGAVIAENDSYCRGVVVLGLDAPADDLIKSFELAADTPAVKGFAIGRTIFGQTARAWLADKIDDEQAVTEMAERFASLCDAWARLHSKTTIAGTGISDAIAKRK